MFQLEKILREMQRKEDGVPIRCQKLFLTSIPNVFTGFDLVEWLMEHFLIPDEGDNNIHLLFGFHHCFLICWRDLLCPPPPPAVFLWPPVTNYMLLYNTLLCKKIARVPGGHKKLMLTKLGGGDRIDPNDNSYVTLRLSKPSYNFRSCTLCQHDLPPGLLFPSPNQRQLPSERWWVSLQISSSLLLALLQQHTRQHWLRLESRMSFMPKT